VPERGKGAIAENQPCCSLDEPATAPESGQARRTRDLRSQHHRNGATSHMNHDMNGPGWRPLHAAPESHLEAQATEGIRP